MDRITLLEWLKEVFEYSHIPPVEGCSEDFFKGYNSGIDRALEVINKKLEMERGRT